MTLRKNLLALGVLLLTGLLLGACSSDKKEGTQQEKSDSASESKGETKAKGCLLAFRENNIQDLVGVEKVAEILGIPADKINVRDNSNLKLSPDITACLFECASETQQGTISVGQIKEVKPEIFSVQYKDEFYSSNGREARYLDDAIGDGAVYVFDSGNVILTVLLGEESFIVQLYANKRSKEENLEIAKKVALEVLKKCM